MAVTQTKFVTVSDGTKIFYRERADNSSSPVFLLLHGFPASSHQYRNLIPLLARKYHVIAPDLPGFGFTEPAAGYQYTFENLAKTIGQFLDALRIAAFNLYIFDYGAPVGLRLALARPDAVQAIVTQNGNAYTEGFGDVWDPIQQLWAGGNKDSDRAAVAGAMLNPDITKFQYVNGTPDPNTIAPESYTLDYALLSRPGNKEIQLDLFNDYQFNVPMYEKFQEYFRTSQVPLLAIWGKNDVFFIPPGAEAFKKDLPKAHVELINAGHFAVESHTEVIAEKILAFLQ